MLVVKYNKNNNYIEYMNIFKKITNVDSNEEKIEFTQNDLNNMKQSFNIKHTPDVNLQNIKTEYRWRRFKIMGHHEYIEISYKSPNDTARFYLSNNGSWKAYDENTLKQYDKYLLETEYYYE
jgi:hypothetical protein